MKVFVRGQGPVELSQQHFVATGGQASVWVKDGTAYKVYTNARDAIPEAKIAALSVISDPAVVKPKALLLDGRSRPVGYAMAAVAYPHSLCQLFAPAFRDRMKVPDGAVPRLAGELRSHVLSVHRAGAQIVDLNELNVLVSPAFDALALIDVDSYQTPGFPATVIMPSVRDWSAKAFDEKSDWFSYAVLAFQLFVGAHPYKGGLAHPEIDSVPRDGRMEWRMRRHLSAFRPQAKLPPSCPPLDVIPQLLRDWLRVVLDEGKRLPPPDPSGAPAVVTAAKAPRALASEGQLLLELVLDAGGVVLAAEDGLLLSRRDGRATLSRAGGPEAWDWEEPRDAGRTLVGVTPKMRRPVALRMEKGRMLSVHDVERKTRETFALSVDEVAKAGERFLVRSESGVYEVDFLEMSDRTIPTAGQRVADVLPLASRLFEGCVVQNLLGSTFVSVFPRSRRGHQLRVVELDGCKVLDARFQATAEHGSRGAGGVLGVLAARAGRYDRFTFRFDERFEAYDVRVAQDVPPGLVNFVVVPGSGVVADLGTDDVLEVYLARKDHASLRRIESAVLGRDLRLVRVGDGIGFTRGSEVWRMRLS